ncbi:MAG: hypothetical protein GX456_10705 [Verrucomicrobia bacterium]|nr:hypothetical protein [Verrucomicrobiota bacterium]
MGVGRREAFGVRQLAAALFLCPNNVSVPMFPISPMTGHATRFDPANRATEHTLVGCGEESPRSCRRVRKNTDGRERGRPRPHQRDDRPYDPFGSGKCGVRTFTGRGCTNNVFVPISHHEKPGERGVLKRHKTLKRNSVGNQSHPAKPNHQP